MNEMSRVWTDRFAEQLGYWALHGSVCAAPSFLLAFSGGYAVSAMLCGVAGLVVVYALVTASRWHRERIGRSRFGRMLKGAVVGRSVIAAVATVGWLGAPPPHWFTGWAVLFDLYPGMLSTGVTQQIWAGEFGQHPVTAFAPTLFNTVLQGLLVSLEFVLLAVVATGGGWVWQKLRTDGRR